MKTIFRLFALTVFVAGSMTAFAHVNGMAGRIRYNDHSNDNKNRKRHGGDDPNSSRSNSNSNSGNSRTTGSLSIEQARNIALQAVPGEIIKEEFENKRGRSIYEFYIRKSSGEIFEVYVDADSGKVIKVERED